jgi:hypothetical protein
MSEGDRERPSRPEAEHVVVVRVGHGANCSSIGSVVDTLFATATIGAAVLAAIVAALRSEGVKVVGPTTHRAEPTPPEKAP